jgi:hypothetical protein
MVPFAFFFARVFWPIAVAFAVVLDEVVVGGKHLPRSQVAEGDRVVYGG